MEIIPAGRVTRCKYCNKPISWQTSFKTNRAYPTDVYALNGQDVTKRTLFHKCLPENVARCKAAQQQLPFQPTAKPTPEPATPASYQPENDTQAAKKRAMQAFIEAANEPQLRQALRVIFNRQTSSEQSMEATVEQNKVGFGGNDAEILSNIYKGTERYGFLKGKQVDLVRRRLKRYHRQLVDGLAKGEWAI